MVKQQPIILCVDDNDATRYSLVRTLQLGGYKVIEASTGAEALRLAEHDPDLITLDVQLPDIHGFEVCRRLKANTKTAHIPILHISASHVEVEDRVQGLKGGADGYLIQPVNNAEVLATVQSLLRLRRAEREAHLKAEEAERAREEVVGLNQRLKETIEQLRVAQATASEREERLRVAQDAAHSGTWDWNVQTGELIWSPEEEALYGFTPGTFTGRSSSSASDSTSVSALPRTFAVETCFARTRQSSFASPRVGIWTSRVAPSRTSRPSTSSDTRAVFASPR